MTGLSLLAYAAAMLALWAVPGPVWLALTARALSGGFSSAWPLAVGVALGDLVWPLAAMLGLNVLEGALGSVLGLLRWLAALVFAAMGALLIMRPPGAPQADRRLVRRGRWAGVSVGLAAVIGNPKAILFYMSALPGFFDLARLELRELVAVALVSAGVPMAGNLCLAAFLGRARQLLSSPVAMRRLNLGSGLVLIAVGAAIPFI